MTSEVGQTDLVSGMQLGSLVDLCMQDYKSLCAVVTICSTLVNIQTDRQHYDRLITGSAVALHCINGDIQSQWEMANFDPLQNGNPFTDCQQK